MKYVVAMMLRYVLTVYGMVRITDTLKKLSKNYVYPTFIWLAQYDVTCNIWDTTSLYHISLNDDQQSTICVMLHLETWGRSPKILPKSVLCYDQQGTTWHLHLHIYTVNFNNKKICLRNCVFAFTTCDLIMANRVQMWHDVTFRLTEGNCKNKKIGYRTECLLLPHLS